jgi:hypothetical protein
VIPTVNIWISKTRETVKKEREGERERLLVTGERE